MVLELSQRSKCAWNIGTARLISRGWKAQITAEEEIIYRKVQDQEVALEIMLSRVEIIFHSSSRESKSNSSKKERLNLDLREESKNKVNDL